MKPHPSPPLGSLARYALLQIPNWMVNSNTNGFESWKLEAGGKPSTKLPPGGLLKPPRMSPRCSWMVLQSLPHEQFTQSTYRTQKHRKTLILWVWNEYMRPVVAEILLETDHLGIIHRSRRNRTYRWLLRGAYNALKMHKHCKSLAF